MQLEPSKLHQSSEKKKMIINMEQAVSKVGEPGDWIDAAADIPQTAEPRGGAAPSHSCLPTTVSPLPLPDPGGLLKWFP